MAIRSRGDVEQDLLDTMADVHRCDDAKDAPGSAIARIRLEDLQAEWITIPEQRSDPEARFEHDRPFHTG